MSGNPLNSLSGRLVLVTVLAVLLSNAAAFALFANERGAALRRAAESNFVERVVFTADRLRAAPAQARARIAETTHDFAIRYAVSPEPEVAQNSGGGARLAHEIGERLNTPAWAQVRSFEVSQDEFEDRLARLEEHRRRRGRGRDDADTRRERGDELAMHRRHFVMMHRSEAVVSLQLEPDSWLNVRGRLPRAPTAPWSVFAAGLFSIFAVGVGAALVARQIGRPLGRLADAARAFGSGDINASAPETGPEDVRRASSAFNAMAERLKRQLGRQRQMLWALSHDLRTPITALRLRAELIDDEAAREKLLAPLAEMETLTEQALALARAGTSDEARVRVDVAEIARTLCGELADIGLAIRADAPEPVFASCRPSEIARALRNLAENAAKHGGGGTMRVSSSDAGEAVVEVMDEGPGVSEQLLARLAEPFFRADAARSSGDGAGLGLAIAQAIAEAHGGRLSFANRSPRGFCATLTLPR